MRLSRLRSLLFVLRVVSVRKFVKTSAALHMTAAVATLRNSSSSRRCPPPHPLSSTRAEAAVMMSATIWVLGDLALARLGIVACVLGVSVWLRRIEDGSTG